MLERGVCLAVATMVSLAYCLLLDIDAHHILPGWSYSLNGKLAKAPKFEELSDFDKDSYSLFKIHTHIDKVGFVWVNFDSSETPMPWETMNGGTDEQPRLGDFALDNYVYHRTWTTNGKYNWKLVGENYNEVSRSHTSDRVCS